MRRYLILLGFISVSVFGQEVPSRMEFAGIKLHFSDKLREELQKEVDMLTASPKYFQIKVDRAKIYFPIIEEIFAEEGVPEDFKFLVLQESALIPDAVSVSNAVGYWQFKDFTAMEVGMRVDKHIDERMHIVASTYGAARYLKKNNTFFDNWLYALQAYQMGAGGALKVVDDKHYGAKAMHLDHNTYWYVKKYLAHKIAFESAVEGNGPLLLTKYNNGSNKTLEQIAKENAIDYDLLTSYNVWLKTHRIPGDKTYTVLLPLSSQEVEKVQIEIESSKPSVLPEKVIIAEESKYPIFDTRKPLFSSEEIRTINGIPGMVAKDERTLIDLASSAGISLSKLMKYNDLTVKDKPVKGQVYYLKRKKAKAPTYYHIVKHDETLWEISQHYGVRLNKLILKNRLNSPKDIEPGLVLWLRYVRPESVPAEYKKIYKEEKSETILAEDSNQKEKKDQVEEKIVEEKLVKDEIFIKSDSTAGYSAEPKEADSLNVALIDNTTDSVGIESSFVEVASSIEDTSRNLKETKVEKDSIIQNIHVILPGETFYSISKKYGVGVVELLEWNGLQINDKLSVGQEIKILQQKIINDPQEILPLRSDNRQGQVHEVKQGETLYQIARKYQITIQELMEWNNKNDYSLSPGEKLIIKK